METRRKILTGGIAISAISGIGGTPAVALPATRIQPANLHDVRLLDSMFKKAVDANVRYLKSLEVGRLLHNFYASAALPTKGAPYGGWESMGIAGHSFGHYLSACALAYAQTGDDGLRDILRQAVGEARAIQARHGDGYLGGTTVERDGQTVDGKIVFEEIRRGDIRSNGFDLNGGWVPIYSYHKIHAGMILAYQLADIAVAKDVAIGMADYLVSILSDKTDAQLQTMMRAEHGGINESLADTYVLSGNRAHLDLARRLFHRAIMEPLAQGRDDLAGKHANTQIPKIIGHAKLHQITGNARDLTIARNFFDIVTKHHSFVIGGNSTAEHFGAPDQQYERIDDKTCESCNTYNMLKLTRALYQQEPSAHWFDYYERAHLNHIMAHQDPENGAFVYFVPLSASAQRQYSTPFDSFWCCVGTGMESHAKHGDSIYWHNTDTAFVNLFIPSRFDWRAKNAQITMRGDITKAAPIEININAQRAQHFTLAVRVPSWATHAHFRLNGANITPVIRDGYARFSNIWGGADVLHCDFGRAWRTEAAGNNPNMCAFMHGPVVMAADMGPTTGDAPLPAALLGPSPLALLNNGNLQTTDGPRAMVPFFAQYHRRTTTYFPVMSAQQWQEESATRAARAAAAQALAARTIDFVQLGEMQPERDHFFTTDIAEPTSRNGKPGRWIMWTQGRQMAFTMQLAPDAHSLHVEYWGADTHKNFDIYADDILLAHETLADAPVDGFRGVDYPLPTALVTQHASTRIRFVTRGSDLSVFTARVVRG